MHSHLDSTFWPPTHISIKSPKVSCFVTDEELVIDDQAFDKQEAGVCVCPPVSI